MVSTDNRTVPYNDLPLDLPHAGRIALRLCRVLQNRAADSFLVGYEDALDLAAQVNEILFLCRLENESPSDEREVEQLRQESAQIGRQLTEVIEKRRIGDDRIGQCIRNLFECLAMGKEGAILSLRAGENPRSLQRPI